jgi:hypothetical protein
MYKKNLTQVTVLFLSLLLLASSQTVTLPSGIALGAGQCTNFTVTRSTPSADALSVTFTYNTSAGLTFNGSSLGSYTVAIPSGQTTSAVTTVCSTTSSTSTTTTNVTLSNSSYTVAGGSTSLVTTVSSNNVVVPSGALVIPRGGCSAAQTGQCFIAADE